MDNTNNITVTKVTTTPDSNSNSSSSSSSSSNSSSNSNTDTDTTTTTYLTGPESEMTSIYDNVNNVLMNPSVIIILVIVVVLYLVLFMTLGGNKSSNNDNSNSNSNSNSNNPGSKIITIIIIVMFIVLVIINGLQYFFGVDIVASIKNLFTGQPEVDISVTNPPTLSQPSVIPEIKIKKQVFNIPGNNYVYPDAKALCTAYGAELANYQQIEEAYNKGGEWCNYGWSDGQMALFPTQQETYDGLQSIPGHENDCGRPGINGGFMANPALKFGVNCYGYKPKMNSNEEELMQEVPVYPKTVNDIIMEKRVDYWKEKIPDILVSPFNHDNWSKI
jgi:hypothetical protein